MRTSNRTLFMLLFFLLIGAAVSRTFITSNRKRAAVDAPQLPRGPSRDPAARSSRPLQVGAPAPDLSLWDQFGGEYRLSRFRGHRVLLAFFCGSPQCIRLAPEWQRIHRQLPYVITLGISTTGLPDVLRLRAATRVTFPLLFDPNDDAAHPDKLAACPSLAVIDEDGIVVYLSGHAGNAPKGSDSLLQHLRLRSPDETPR